MTGRTLLGLGLALASAVALNWGFFVQHRAASDLPPLSVRRPLHSLRLLFTDRRWLSGYVVGIGGWGMYIIALAFAPLSLVQASAAGGIGVLALLVRWVSGSRLSRREWAGVWTALTGLALLGASLSGATSAGARTAWIPVALWVGASVALAGLAASPSARSLAPGAGLGTAAGTMYAAGDVATKAAMGHAGHLGFVPVLLLCHLLGFVALQEGFQEGGALATAGIASLLNNALPIAGGLAIFHDSLPGGVMGTARVAAFAAVVLGAVLLARPGPPADEPAEAVGPDRSARAGRGPGEGSNLRPRG